MSHKDFFIWLSGFLAAVETNTHFDAIKIQMSKVDPIIVENIKPINDPLKVEKDERLPVPEEAPVVKETPGRRKSPFKPVTANKSKVTDIPTEDPISQVKEKVVFRI
jgi:hypothetical protein